MTIEFYKIFHNPRNVRYTLGPMVLGIDKSTARTKS